MRATARGGPWRRVWPAVGFYVLGVASVFGGGWVIDHTNFTEAVVAPLMLRDTDGRADVIVALAAGITDACTPNEFSLRRALLAARLYREGRASRVLFTGGTPTGMSCAVASVMAGTAREAGVPAEAIAEETASRTTWENAKFSAPVLRSMGASRVLLVTDQMHMRRSEASFAQFGFAVERAAVPAYETSGGNSTKLYLGLRELIGMRVYRWRGWIVDSPAPGERGDR